MARPHSRAPLRATHPVRGDGPRAARGRERTARGPAAVGGVVVLLLAACSGGSGGAAGDSAAESASGGAAASRSTVSSGADCLAPQVLADLGFDPAAYTGARHPEVPEAVPLPTGFTAESAVSCRTGETLTDTDGTWAAVTASRLEGDVRPLVEALTAPATRPATGGAASTCAPGADRTELWLVDALGVAVRVVLPGTACDPLASAVADGLDALDVVDVEHYPVALVSPRPAASTAPTD